MNTTTADLLNMIQSGNTTDANKVFDVLMAQNLESRIEARKGEIAQTLFQTVDPVSTDNNE